MEQTELLELVTNEILVTWDDDPGMPSSLLSSLNVFLDFLKEFDRVLARAAGSTSELELFLEGLEEKGFRFTLRLCLVPSRQLYLGEKEIQEPLKDWLMQMHCELLSRMTDLFDVDGLEKLFARAQDVAGMHNLDREIFFSLNPGKRNLSRIQKRYDELLVAQYELISGISLKILKK